MDSVGIRHRQPLGSRSPQMNKAPDARLVSERPRVCPPCALRQRLWDASSIYLCAKRVGFFRSTAAIIGKLQWPAPWGPAAHAYGQEERATWCWRQNRAI